MCKMSQHFPLYKDFDPLVPVWCITPDLPGCMHRFFDSSAISPSGRYVAVLQLQQELSPPQPGEAAKVYLIDLHTGKSHFVAETCGWEPQMGANINWGDSDHCLFFNDVDLSTWQPFAWKMDPLNGRRQRMQGSVYHASSDGRWLISANMTTMCKTQPGYGVSIPHEKLRRNIGAVEDDGFYLTDTASGETRLLLSIADILKRSLPPILIDDPLRYEIYGFHSKFNPQNDRLMLSLRWFPAQEEARWNLFASDPAAVDFAWITTDLQAKKLHCAVGPEQWRKGGHHATWFPDGKRISMNLDIDQDGMRFVQVFADGSQLCKMLDHTLGSGHPTVHPDGKHIVTDTYTSEPLAFGDGTIPLRWINLDSGTEETIVRIHTQSPVEDGTMRIDPHPAWDRSWRYLTFNAFVGGTRRVFIADMQQLIG